MSTAEKLARELVRVTRIRTLYAQRNSGAYALDTIEAAIEQSCRAIGSGDEGVMVAAGLVLETIVV